MLTEAKFIDVDATPSKLNLLLIQLNPWRLPIRSMWTQHQVLIIDSAKSVEVADP
jgi:hypothetical protein